VGLADRLLRRTSAPAGALGTLDADEVTLAVAELREGHLVATTRGLWVPDDGGPLRVPWHLVSRATWDGRTLELTVAEQTGTAGAAVLLADVARRSYVPTQPGTLPRVVNDRVTATVRSSHHRRLPGGGAWFVQRSTAGTGGVVLQVRVEPGTDIDVVRDVAAAVASQLPRHDGLPA